jgi:protoporphyrinogen oxidase/cytochrome b involved in lipid metabolism
MDIYDYLIAGAGIAGLYTAYHIIKHDPNARICILEASSRIGGRLHSIALEDNKVIEAGGARFNTQQHRILALIHELGLDFKKIAIHSNSKYIPVRQDYDPQLETLFPEIDNIINKLAEHIQKQHIPDNTLEKTNLLDLIHTTYSHQYPTIKKYLIARYPYYSELHTLNALEGISLFTNEFSKKMRYFILAGGLEQLITTISQHLKKYSNVYIHLATPLESISGGSDSIYSIKSLDKEYHTQRIILALPQPALAKITYLMGKPAVRRMINAIQPEPLYRIYARYPLDEKTGKVWFAGMSKVVSNLPIKYIIPINEEHGIIMISYTDSKFARYWFNKLAAGDDILQKELARQLELLFPELEIPEPLWLKHYYWDMGAGYWKPGHSRKEIMPKITHPLANEEIYICNENYSSHQAWVEGSLESADCVLEKLGITPRKKSISRTKNTKRRLKKQIKQRQKQIPLPQRGGAKATKKRGQRQYTLEEVAKHNKKSDAWIVIDGKVADITEWIPKHPGGNVIMKGAGKDATALFTNIGHDEYAKKMLKKYQIGILGS